MKPFLLAIGCLVALYSPAQRTIDVDKNDVSGTSPNFFIVVGGQPFVNTKFARLVEGSPYFSNEWMRGNVVLEGGKQYVNVELKLDLLDHEVHYRDAKGNEMIANSIPQKVILFDTIAQRIYNFIYYTFLPPTEAETQKGWYLLLGEEGNAAIYKQIIKTLNESKPYGSATVEQSIKTSNHYFIAYKNALFQFKKIKEIPDILTDKRKELLQYLGSHKLSEKNDSDLEELLQYYTSLK